MEPQNVAESISVSGLNPGYIIGGRYELQGLLARGGMGAVYRARHITLDKPVAVKVLRAGDVEATTFQRFQAEAKAAAALSHPHLINVQDYGQLEDGNPYIVMEYIEGRALSAVLKQEGPLEEKRAVTLFAQICEGLAHAHTRGVIHRDLKPSNIVLVQGAAGEELVKIVDFGVAKRLLEDQHLTRTGQVFGTPLYMSPEQCAAKGMDARSDIYSLGCLMFEILSGRTPFHPETPLETMFKHCTEPAPPVNAIRSGAPVSMELEEIIDRCLRKHPDHRFQSAVELHAALRGEAPRATSIPAAPSASVFADEGADSIAPTTPMSGITTQVLAATTSEQIGAAVLPTKSHFARRNPIVIAAGVAAVTIAAVCLIPFKYSGRSDSTLQAPPLAVPAGSSAESAVETAVPLPEPVESPLTEQEKQSVAGHRRHVVHHVRHTAAKPSLWHRIVNGFKNAF